MKQLIRQTINLADDLFCLFFPNLCLGCGQPLTRGEEAICTLCHFHLPKTWFHNDPDNPLNKVFWGRVQLEAVASYLYFQKGGTVQHLLHQLKYKDRPEIGFRLGKWYGMELRQADIFREAELVVPVPLHPRKFRKRGYNQSEVFAEGLAEKMGIRLETRSLYRTLDSQTQTRKTRFDRWENVESIFAISQPERISGKHILLVDDVLTTGATLEASATALLGVPGVRVSVATIAYASY